MLKIAPQKNWTLKKCPQSSKILGGGESDLFWKIPKLKLHFFVGERPLPLWPRGAANTAKEDGYSLNDLINYC